MRDEQYADSGFMLKVGEKVQDLRLDRHVKRRGGLVGQDQSRLEQQGVRDQDALKHAPREFVRVGAQHPVRILKPHADEKVADATVRVPGPVMIAKGHAQLGADGKQGVERGGGFLEDHGDLGAAHGADFGRGHLQEIATPEPGFAGQHDGGGGGQKPEQSQARHRFAATRFSHETEDLTGSDFKGNGVRDGSDLAARAESEREVLDAQQGFGGRTGHAVKIIPEERILSEEVRADRPFGGSFPSFYIPSMTPEPSVYLQAAVAAVRAAGAVALSRQKTLGPSRFKGAKDVVTEADLECDALIRARLLKEFPDHDLLTEEEGAFTQGSDYCWIVDPIDGTINYAHGIPLWGVSVGLSYKGAMLCGAIYLPVYDELYTAVVGGGAFLNGVPIRVGSCAEPSEAIVSHGDFNVGANDAERHELNAENFWGRMRTVAGVQRVKCLGSAVVEGAYVAIGRLDGYWMGYFKPWDVAVTTLLVTEAGGKVTDLQGLPWTLDSRTVLFSNGTLHAALLEALDWDSRRLPGPRA
jgi:myo-inositol-1(or 4)-monophosphatase